MIDQAEKGQRFRDLHHSGQAFVLPNPWDIGSAKLVASLGYEALATTSAGFAHSLGRPDGGVTRDQALAHCAAIVLASDLPVSADLENGFGHDPAEVADTVLRAAETGLAGCSVEDASGDPAAPIYPFDLAVARVAAAVAAVETLGSPFVLTARSENFLHDRPDLGDTIRRLQAFEEAGAEVLYAPALPDLAAMAEVVAAVGRPVNLLADPRYTLDQLRGTGAARISLGSALSRAAYGALLRAGREVATMGTFGFLSDAASSAELNGLFGRPPAG